MFSRGIGGRERWSFRGAVDKQTEPRASGDLSAASRQANVKTETAFRIMEQAGTVDKAVQVLWALCRAQGGVSLGALSGELSLPKPTVHRLLSTLQSHDLVEQRKDGHYALGVGLLRLGLGAQAGDPFVRAARPELECAARELGETFFLVAARGGKLVVLEKVEGTGMLRAAPEVGGEVPVPTTATGRLFLALAPELLSPSAQPTRSLRAAVARARARGFDLNQGEWIFGLTVVAAPVHTGRRMFGTVACAGADSQLRGERLQQAIDRTKQAAARIMRALSVEGGEER